MKQAEFLPGRRIEIRDVAPPEAAEGEARVRVRGCALCGSDMRLWRNGSSVTPGHEITGVVEQLGHKLNGRRVVVYIPVFCGTCEACGRGDTHLCTTQGALIGWQRAGGYADYLSVPDQCLIPIEDDIETSEAPLLLDVIGTPAHAIRMARRIVQSGPVAVIGAGPIGLGGVVAAQNLGFADISVAEPHAGRRAAALAFDARLLAEGADASRFALVLETSGSNAGRQRALELTRAHGVCVFLGESDRWEIAETKPIRRKDFFVLRSFYFPISEFDANLAMLRADRQRYRRFIDEVAPLEGLQGMFERFSAGERIKPQMAPAT
ncbi:MAG: alcohol dehydrogenase catalytic domain-containing protein [Hyphomicrobiales bacterium]